ncbi:MAG: formate C-acetyltransferase [Firmicutes bacterium HGW-Firmicutes-7]|nr:MAG: formate C-acetyltransferase [Firmicutes bacterium HGW-Firmicutes-7]
MEYLAWQDFKEGNWTKTIDVRDFILKNITPYYGDESFLAGATKRTKEVLAKLEQLLEAEAAKDGVLEIDTKTVSSLLTFEPGYIDKDQEIIVGLQTDKPLKRAINPFGGIKMTRSACKAYGYELDDKVEQEFAYKTTHNDGVFRVYTEEMRAVRKNGIITGLPDAYGRGRIIGDYRRVALYGVNTLIEHKEKDQASLGNGQMTEKNIRLMEEVFRQIDFLDKLKAMAKMYGHDISLPATNAKEAIQWTYYGYLAAIKEQNGAAMSLGRVSTFFDIFIERDIKNGILNEEDAQELIDDFVIKLRMARQLRTPDYNELFAGDPTWVTESIGGISEDGRMLVSKSSYRFLNTLYTLKPSPEPNLTVLWSNDLPDSFKKYCAKVSMDTDSIQYENDDIMRARYGDDYGIACCVSAMKLGEQMQYFGARCNLPKVFLLALNGGIDELSGMKIGPQMAPIGDGTLDFEEVMLRFKHYQSWLCKLYVNTMNVIHYMHDKYAYEKIQMALHNTEVERFMAFGMAGLSVMADSLSAIKYAKVKPIKNENGLIVDFEIQGEFPKFGNNNDQVDQLSVDLTNDFINELRKYPTYREAIHTLSILTITSNVVYGKKTGATPDGRKAGEAYAPGANPMHNRDEMGALASLESVAKIPYEACRDGISCTFTIQPKTLGKTEEDKKVNLAGILDGYFSKKAHHLNVNVLNKETLVDAMDHPENYPNLTIRVSGYAVNFIKLSKKQQLEVISRTFHEKI